MKLSIWVTVLWLALLLAPSVWAGGDDMGYQVCDDSMRDCRQVWTNPVAQYQEGESTRFSTTSTGYLRVDKASVDALLREYPDAQLKMALYEYDEKAGVWNRARPAPCLAQLEAAMKLIDPHLDPHDGDSKPQDWLAHIWRTQWEAWQKVKRQCWRQP